MPDVQTSERQRIGVFGGTFDPPHIGHLVAAVDAHQQLALDRVLLVVANRPWQKAGDRGISSASDRLEMVRRAIDGIDGLEASTLEIDRGGDSYTIDTLEALSSERPDAELYLLVGSDAAALLDTWHDPERLRELCRIVVFVRPGSPAGRPPAGWDHSVLQTPLLDVSSTDLRERVRSGRPIDFLVPDAVRSFLDDRGLYRFEPVRSAPQR